MGLLDQYSAQPQQQAPQGMAAPQGGGGLQMAQQLAANPTPQMAQQIVMQLKQSGNPEAAQFEQFFAQAGSDPAKIKQIADFVIQHLSGGQ